MLSFDFVPLQISSKIDFVVLVGLFQFGKIVQIIFIVVVVVIVVSAHSWHASHSWNSTHASASHAAHGTHLFHQSLHVHSSGHAASHAGHVASHAGHTAHSRHSSHAHSSLHVAHIESLFLLVLIDVSVPINLDLVLFQGLVLQEAGPEFFFFLVFFQNVHLDGSWQDLVGRSLRVDLLEEFDIDLVGLVVAGSLEFEGRVGQNNLFVLDVCPKEKTRGVVEKSQRIYRWMLFVVVVVVVVVVV